MQRSGMRPHSMCRQRAPSTCRCRVRSAPAAPSTAGLRRSLHRRTGGRRIRLISAYRWHIGGARCCTGSAGCAGRFRIRNVVGHRRRPGQLIRRGRHPGCHRCLEFLRCPLLVPATHGVHRTDDNNQKQCTCRHGAPGQEMEAIFLLGTPLLAKFPAWVRFFEHNFQQWVAWLTRTPLQFGDNPFPTSGLKRFPPHALRVGWCFTSHTSPFEKS
jgi:hypothetical protein